LNIALLAGEGFHPPGVQEFYLPAAFDMRSLAVTVAIATVVWTVALGVSAARAATFVVDVSAHRETD
jgi:hypothetical protein